MVCISEFLRKSGEFTRFRKDKISMMATPNELEEATSEIREYFQLMTEVAHNVIAYRNERDRRIAIIYQRYEEMFESMGYGKFTEYQYGRNILPRNTSLPVQEFGVCHSVLHTHPDAQRFDVKLKLNEQQLLKVLQVLHEEKEGE